MERMVSSSDPHRAQRAAMAVEMDAYVQHYAHREREREEQPPQ
jgi:hypothetical protein